MRNRSALCLFTVVTLIAASSSALAQREPRPTKPGPKRSVTFSTQPPQAAVYIDDKKYGVEGYTPTTVKLPAGNYTVILELPGFKTIRHSIYVAKAREKFAFILERELPEPVAAPAPPPPPPPPKIESQKGVIIVTCDHDGADVYVDGTRIGSAPSRTETQEGDHFVEVRKSGSPTWRKTVHVKGGETLHMVAEIVVPAPVASPLPSAAPVAEPPRPIVDDSARLRVITPIPDAEVYIDGALAGTAPIDRTDLVAGEHHILVRKNGYADWKRTVELKAGKTVTLSADLSSAGGIKVVSNVPGADVYLDGTAVGKTPMTLENVSPGDHLVEVRALGYASAKQTLSVHGGESKTLTADLAPEQRSDGDSSRRRSLEEIDSHQRRRLASTWGAITLEPKQGALDLGGGFNPFANARLMVGAFRYKYVGLDAGVEFRSTGYMNVAGLIARIQMFEAGPFSIGGRIFIGGGGGPTLRNTVEFEFGLPITLTFGEIVRLTAEPYALVYSDRNCPAKAKDNEPTACTSLPPAVNQDPRTRFTSGRLMLRAALEVMATKWLVVWGIVEGDPISKRASFSGEYAGDFVFQKDPQIYGRLGVTFKF